MATENIQKGWLYTREGEKFAPETLVENVTTRSGKPYDERVREYLNTLNTSLTQKINNVKTEVDSSGKDYDAAISALQSKDSSHDSSIAALRSKDSSHDSSIAALRSKDTQLDADITALENKLQYFDGTSSDKLYIVDNNDKVVAYIDGTGVHSIDFLIGTDNKSVAEQLKWFIANSNNEAFYFVDDSSDTDPQVAAKIDESGIDAVDFRAKGQDYSLVGLNTAHNTMENNLEEYYGYNNFEHDTFYFIDKSTDPKVGTMVNASGITTTNITFANRKNAKENMMFFEKLGAIDIQF